MVSIEFFYQLEFKVVTILEAEPVGETDRLIKLMFDLGGEKRQIISGIKPWYQPKDLVGKQVVIVANLEPKEIKGVLSHGMLLAADTSSGPVLVTPEKPVPNGTRVV